MDINKVTLEFYEYLISEKNCSPLTVDAYTRDMNLFTHALYLNNPNIDVENITTPMIRKYINFMKDTQNYKATTINRKINSLRSFFKFLISQGYIISNPAAPVTAPKKPERIPIYLKEDDLKKLIEAPEKYSKDHKVRDKLILETFIYTGIRRSELLHLNWIDVDFGLRVLSIKHGKGDKQRNIPLNDILQKDLWGYLQTRLPLKIQCLFISDEGNRLSTTALQQMFTRYIHLTGLSGKGYTIHKLRHSFATMLIKRNVNLIAIQELMGHTDINSTKIYTHIDMRDLRQQIDKIIIFKKKE